MSKRSRKVHRTQRWQIVDVVKFVADELGRSMRLAMYNQWINGQ